MIHLTGAGLFSGKVQLQQILGGRKDQEGLRKGLVSFFPLDHGKIRYTYFPGYRNFDKRSGVETLAKVEPRRRSWMPRCRRFRPDGASEAVFSFTRCGEIHFSCTSRGESEKAGVLVHHEVSSLRGLTRRGAVRKGHIIYCHPGRSNQQSCWGARAQARKSQDLKRAAFASTARFVV